jgi:hypothetical protein
VPDQLLTILKLCLLALLYLFFLRVLRAVWVEVGGPRRRQAAVEAGPAPLAVPAAASPPNRRAAKAARGAPAAPAKPAKPAKAGRRRPAAPQRLVVVAPADHEGLTFPLGEEVTLGRAAGCAITLDDAYVSQVHARFFMREGVLYVEDMGSTNGTYLNRAKVAGPMLVGAGDQVQIGSTVLEVA